MTRLSISKAWDETKAILARDGKLLATVAAALFLLPQVIVGLVSGQGTSAEPPGGAAGLLMALAAIIGLVGQLAVVRMSLGRSVSVGEAIGHGLRRAPLFLLSLLVVLIAVVSIAILAAMLLGVAGVIDLEAIGSGGEPNPRDVALVMVLLLIPFLIIAVRLLLLAPIVSEERLGPIAALRRSWQLTRGNGWRLFGFIILFIIGAAVLTLAVAMVATIIVRLFLGSTEPFSAGALVLSLFGGTAQALVTLVYVVMIARLYAQTGATRAEEVEEIFR